MVTSIQCEGDLIQNITIKLKYNSCCTMHVKLALIRLNSYLIDNPLMCLIEITGLHPVVGP